MNVKYYALSILNGIANHNDGFAKTIVDIPKTLTYVVDFLSPDFMDLKIQVGTLDVYF